MLAADAVALTQRASAAARSAAARLEGLRPAYVLAPLCLLQIAIGAWFAFRTPHNGWVWYSGGDSTEYWTDQWAIAHGVLPRSVLGYGVPFALFWVPLVTGATLLQGLAVIAPLQLAVLVPLALVCFWGVADRLFGRLFAWWATALWVLAPLLLIAGFTPSYRGPFEQYFLVPHWFGMTNMGDLPSLVTVLACAWATLRALDTHARGDAVVAGLLGGLAIGVKPANAFFVVAVAVLFAVTRRWRLAAEWAVGIVPAVVTLAVWKQRALGDLPILKAADGTHLAAGHGGVGLLAASGLSRYFNLDFGHVHLQLIELGQYFWSMRLLEFLLVGGLVGVWRRSPAKAGFLFVWVIGYCIFKATSPDSQMPSASYFRLALPGLPAYLLIAASLVYCVPVLGRPRTAAAAGAAAAPAPRAPWRFGVSRRVAVAFAVCGLLPLAVAAALPAPGAARTIRDESSVQEAPLSDAFHLTARRNADSSVTLSWRLPPHGTTSTWFVLYTMPTTDGCTIPPSGAHQCVFELPLPVLATTRSTSFVDHPGPAQHYYRLALVANYESATQWGDLMLVSPAVHVPAVG